MKIGKYKEKFIELQRKKKNSGSSDYIVFGLLVCARLLSWKDFLSLLKELIPEDDYALDGIKETEEAILQLWKKTSRGKSQKLS